MFVLPEDVISAWVKEVSEPLKKLFPMKPLNQSKKFQRGKKNAHENVDHNGTVNHEQRTRSWRVKERIEVH